jgi:glycosyltransferase involved in cell wall biosynthesis
VRKLLYLIAGLNYEGASRQMSWLASRLAGSGYRIHVVILQETSVLGRELTDKLVSMDYLAWKRAFDLSPLFALRRIVKASDADVIHLWGLGALRAFLAAGRGWDRVVACSLLPATGRPSLWNRWLMRQSGAVLALGHLEQKAYRELGVDQARLHAAAPGVPVDPGTGQNADEPLPADLGLSWVTPEHQVVLGVGPFTRVKGFYDAVYALDMLHFLHPNLHLVLAGSGPEEARIRFLAGGLRIADHVHFVGDVPDLGPLLRRADLCWVPSQGNTGRYALLEAMAAGKAVVAGDVPLLRECAVHDESALFTPAGDKMAIARETRLLLDDPAQASRIGEAARRSVREHFPLGALVAQCEKLYLGVG